MHDPLEAVLRLVAEGGLSPEEAAPIIDALSSARQAAERTRAAGDAARDAARSAGEAARAFAARRGSGDPARPSGPPFPPGPGRPPAPGTPPGPPRRLRVQVREDGRTTVDLQLPGVLAELASAVPGIPAAYVDRIREALRTGVRGPIVEVADEDGSGVTITLD